MKKLALSVLVLSVCALASCGKKDEPTKPTPPPVVKPNTGGTGSTDPKKKDDPKKLSDEEIGGGTTAQWKTPDSEDLYSKFDLETLWIDGKVDKYTAEYLGQFITLQAKGKDGKPYTFTAEDLKKTQILGLQYDEDKQNLLFSIKYNGSTAISHIALKLDKERYLRGKITVDQSIISKKYISVVGKSATSLFKYDTNRYSLEVKKGAPFQVDSKTLTVKCTLSVLNKNSGKELGALEFELKGFKSFEELKNDLKVSVSPELITILKNTPKEHKMSAFLKDIIDARLLSNGNLLSYKIGGKKLTWVNSDLLCIGEQKDCSEYIFPKISTRVQTASFRVEGGKTIFSLTIKFNSINDIPLKSVILSASTEIAGSN